MITYKNVRYHLTEKVFWQAFPFKIWLIEQYDKNGTGTRKERTSAFQNLRNVPCVGRHSTQPGAMALYCKTREDCEAVLKAVDLPNVQIHSIYGPRDEEHLAAMGTDSRLRTRDLYHGKYKWQIKFGTPRLYLKYADGCEVMDWFETMGCYIRPRKVGGRKLRTIPRTEDYALERINGWGNRVMIGYARDDGEMLIMKLAMAHLIKKVTMAVPLDKNNNKEGKHEPNAVSEICRTEVDCQGGTSISGIPRVSGHEESKDDQGPFHGGALVLACNDSGNIY